MRFFGRKHLQLTLRLICFWILAAYLFVIVRYTGHWNSATNPLNKDLPLDYGMFFVLANIGGIIVGIVFSFVEITFERTRFQRMSYGRLILTKSAIYLLIITLSFSSVTIINYVAIAGAFSVTEWFHAVFSARLIPPLLFMTVASLLMSFIRQISFKFGPGNLWKIMTGAFHHPREEERIFMFLDLQSSTTIAEKLGHIRYSQLIQDCFNDLPIVENNDSEVYQYVGDEIVLSWSVRKGIRENNCIKAYFNYVNYLQSRRTHYQAKYGLQPVFKAGMSLGKITTAEVGIMKKEIAYHGDTLNTASRIQEMCNVVNKRLLISEFLNARLEATNDYIIKPMGSMTLRGKETGVELFSVEETKDN